MFRADVEMEKMAVHTHATFSDCIPFCTQPPILMLPLGKSLVSEILVPFIIYNELSVISATYIKLTMSQRTISLPQKTEKDAWPLLNTSMDYDASSLPPEGYLMTML
jgi:hypothetical protein